MLGLRVSEGVGHFVNGTQLYDAFTLNSIVRRYGTDSNRECVVGMTADISVDLIANLNQRASADQPRNR